MLFHLWAGDEDLGAMNFDEAHRYTLENPSVTYKYLPEGERPKAMLPDVPASEEALAEAITADLIERKRAELAELEKQLAEKEDANGSD